MLPEPRAPKPAPPVTIFREAIGGSGIGTGSFDGPVDVAASADGGFYVLDAGNQRVQRFDSFSKFEFAWGTSGSRPTETAPELRNPVPPERVEFKDPRALAVNRGGFVYVVDSGNDRIQKFDRSGSLIGLWGGRGSREGFFNNPLDIALDGDSNNWIVDAGNNRLQKFDASGHFLLAWGAAFNRGGGDFQGLVSVAWTEERFGYLYLLSQGCLVQQFQPDGVLVKSWSAVAPESDLCVPERIRVDEENDFVYVLDSGNSLLMRFTRDGQFLAALSGAERTFLRPRGFAIKPDVDLVLVADTDNDIVQKFTLR